VTCLNETNFVEEIYLFFFLKRVLASIFQVLFAFWFLTFTPLTVPMASSPHRSGGEGDSKGDKRPRFFDTKTKNICWTKADTVPGRHPERWRKDAAGNIVCKRFFNCLGCLCYEYDHIIPYSKGSIFLSPF